MPGEYSQQTIAAHFDQTNKRLAAIEEQLSLVSRQLGLDFQPFTQGVPQDVVDMARSGDKLGAMKRYRELTQATFDEARDVVTGL
jgi:ribosomal protein L7/L12